MDLRDDEHEIIDDLNDESRKVSRDLLELRQNLSRANSTSSCGRFLVSPNLTPLPGKSSSLPLTPKIIMTKKENCVLAIDPDSDEGCETAVWKNMVQIYPQNFKAYYDLNHYFLNWIITADLMFNIHSNGVDKI